MQSDIIVLKFGSSVLRSPADLPAAVHEIYRWYREGARILAVVSALGRTTEQLLAQARELSVAPEPYSTAQLLATGERSAAALLGVALDRAGVPARVLDPGDIGLTVAGDPLDSEPEGVDVAALRRLFERIPVAVLPGFFGYDEDDSLHLLGRGGSDLSAVFLAQSLGAPRCRLLKDVDGVYESDPALAGRPRRFNHLNYVDALRVAGRLIQPKAVNWLAACGGSVEVAGLGCAHESRVHAGATDFAEVSSAFRATRVALLGLGTVGYGVYQRLRAMPEQFTVVGALVREPDRHVAQGVPRELLHGDEDAARRLEADVVVDALPGSASTSLVRHFLERGIDAVSANKALIAANGPGLGTAASTSGARLRYAAAVGGGAPMLEAVRAAAHRAPISRLEGILNGTCNFLLDRCADGVPLCEAIAAAQDRGFAEADPSEDLSGRDAERKLRILFEHAVGEPLTDVTVEPFTAQVARAAQDAARRGRRLRQVARVHRDGSRWHGRVGFDAVDGGQEFAAVCGEWNALVVTHSDGGSVHVAGRGAGRWPTTESIIADLFEVRRHRSRT